MKRISLQYTNISLTLLLSASLVAGAFNSSVYAQTSVKEQYAAKVKSEFLFAWNNYRKYAWGHDELRPLSRTYFDWYGKSLLMTPVDAYDTMVLMGLKKEAQEDEQLIDDSLSFDKDIVVSNFEITIRMLGGLLSGYELNHDRRFLELATDLANRLLPVFNSATGMPYRFVNLKTGKVSGVVSNPAEIGTETLELGTLSKLTGNPVYFEKAKKAVVALFNRRSKIGLVGSAINVETGEWVSTESHISGGIDSYYEYLLKAWKLFGDKDFKNMWDVSVAAVNKYLAQEVNGELWYGHANMDSGVVNRTYFGALDAFFPAELALGGDLKKAEELENSCYKMWLYYGIEPEQINYTDMSILDSGYVLRPENIESNYYLYKFTHDPEYLCRAETYFNTFVYNCRVKDGFASLASVTTKKHVDDMESFVFAETFKYLYLSFAPDSALDFNKIIFNTEAHPLHKNFK
jgi:Glycosyl hydrolase family 47